jgi:hypothetical protein
MGDLAVSGGLKVASRPIRQTRSRPQQTNQTRLSSDPEIAHVGRSALASSWRKAGSGLVGWTSFKTFRNKYSNSGVILRKEGTLVTLTSHRDQKMQGLIPLVPQRL